MNSNSLRRALRALSIPTALIFGLTVQAGQELDPRVLASDIEAHVRYLASDELKGRETGSPEIVVAARHLAAVLKSIGVQPAGDDGGYLQRVPLVTVEHDGPPKLVATLRSGETAELEHGVDFSAYTRGVPRDTGEVKVHVVRERGELPESAATDAAIYVDAKLGDKRAWLADAGLSEEAGFGMQLQVSRNAGRPGGTLPSGRPLRASGEAEAPIVKLKGDWRDKLLADEIEALALEWDARTIELEDYNVVGILPGVGTPEQPELAREVVVVSAHFDHIGLLPERAATEEGADRICNGADDDASGVAAVLEIAAALAREEPSARTLVILLATGEEKGLLGTWHYIDEPVGGLENTVLNLNFEMLGRPDPAGGGAGQLWLTGYERSNLGPACVEAGIAVTADPHPEQNFFLRSDNIAFVRRGIVGQTFSSYNLHQDYHRPSDEADTIDFEHMEAATRIGLGAVRFALRGDWRPEWNEGEPKLR